MIKVFQPKRFEDERGYFSPVWKVGDVSINESFSKERTFRGLHVQTPSQRKEVRVLSGSIVDFWVSPDGFGGAKLFHPWDGVIEIPAGHLHGFYALEDSTVQYLVDGKYNPTTEKTYSIKSPGILWVEVEPGLEVTVKNIISDVPSHRMSEKDRNSSDFIPLSNPFPPCEV